MYSKRLDCTVHYDCTILPNICELSKIYKLNWLIRWLVCVCACTCGVRRHTVVDSLCTWLHFLLSTLFHFAHSIGWWRFTDRVSGMHQVSAKPKHTTIQNEIDLKQTECVRKNTHSNNDLNKMYAYIWQEWQIRKAWMRWKGFAFARAAVCMYRQQ